MEEDDKKRLRVHCTRIIQNVRAKDVVGYLFADNVLSADEMERVTLPILTTQEGMLKLLVLLLTKQGAFCPFCNALIETGSDWLVDELKEIDVTSIPQDLQSPLDEILDQNETGERINMLRKQLDQQSIFIEMLMQQQTCQPADSADGRKLQVSDMPKLKQAMDDNDLSEKEVIDYIDYLVKQKVKLLDDTDHGKIDRRRSTCVNFTETVSLKIALDIVSFLSLGENAPPPQTKYEATMRRIVSELINKNKQLFEGYIKEVIINQTESEVSETDFLRGINSLIKVADGIFNDRAEYKWGRVAAFYTFCGWLAKHDVFSDEGRQAIGEFNGYYVSQKLGDWIDENGGWDSFVDHFPENKQKTSYLLPVALLGIGVVLLIYTITKRS